MPSPIHNIGNYIISLGRLCEWLEIQATELGVDILPGVTGDKIKWNEDGSVAGVVTGDMGIGKDGQMKSTFSPGIEI